MVIDRDLVRSIQRKQDEEAQRRKEENERIRSEIRVLANAVKRTSGISAIFVTRAGFYSNLQVVGIASPSFWDFPLPVMDAEKNPIAMQKVQKLLRKYMKKCNAVTKWHEPTVQIYLEELLRKLSGKMSLTPTRSAAAAAAADFRGDEFSYDCELVFKGFPGKYFSETERKMDILAFVSPGGLVSLEIASNVLISGELKNEVGPLDYRGQVVDAAQRILLVTKRSLSHPLLTRCVDMEVSDSLTDVN